ncbi:MAG: aminopeptidase, partial [Thermoplasmata archaeon]|nr:aminopeptidase [Thermoplasmata archaeon]
QKIAEVLLHHSTKTQKGEKVLIEAFDIPPDLPAALIKEANKSGAHPFLSLKQNSLLRELYSLEDKEIMQLSGEFELARMRKMDAYIGVRGALNISELSDVPDDGMKLYRKHWWKPVHIRERVPNTKWVVLRYPTPSMAQQAGMSTEAFETFYFDVCTLDYGKMDKAMDPLKELMERTDRVHITGPGTDLKFSIKGLPVIKCAGERNIPDGECFTAPVKDSVNGVISYNTPTIYQGTTFENIRLEFEKGKIIKAASSDTEKLNNILDSDEGARYIGEFALGFNPYIVRPMKDILFDEKIMGSFHFTPGNAYDEADNGNRSEIHWDMVCIQTKECGGGDIWFDDALIRKDGMFVPEELKGLNPENLK